MADLIIPYFRYSSDEQEDGDSLERQERVCRQFAESQGWVLDSPRIDRGLSAFKGEHLEARAELGRFTLAVAAGEVPHGTVLLAEKLDRLTRRPYAEAMAWVYSLTSQGVRIALADTGKIHDANLDIGSFIKMAIDADQSHTESKKKSGRVISAKLSLWADAERKVGKWTNLAGRPPLWLKRNATCDDWLEDKDRIALIRDIYQWSADGLGAVTITSRLNSSGERPWGAWRRYHDGKWSRTSVATLLDNPAVEGDFVGRTGIFKGKVIHGFYPRIVDADVVAAARDQMRSRKRRTGEWKGEARSTKRSAERTERAGSKKKSGAPPQKRNLFAGKTRCEVCGQRVYLTTQNRKGKTYSYLRCESAVSKRCTNSDYYPYSNFEETALDLCIDLALDDHFFEATGELREARIRKAELEKVIKAMKDRRQSIIRAFEDDDSQALEIAAALKAEITDHQRQLDEATRDIERHSGRANAVEHLRRVTDIRQAACSDDPAIAEQARSKLRTALSAIIHSVTVGPWNGEKVYTMIFRMGTFGVQITPDGKIKNAVTKVDGKPLWEFMPAEHQAMAKSLIRRIEQHGTLEKVEKLVR